MNEIEEQVLNSPLTKEEAREQFELKTKEFGLKHAYTFDEAWDMMEDFKAKKAFRANITNLQSTLQNSGMVRSKEEMMEANPVKHTFADGLYMREIFNPKDELIVTKVHKKQHVFVLSQGEMSIISEKGITRIKAPYSGVTEPETKRIIYAHTDCIFTTIHSTELTDIEEIENTLVSDEYENDLLENESIVKSIQQII